MVLFILAVAMILCGGILPLLFWRQFGFSKALSLATIGAGCLVGVIDAGAKLHQQGTYSVAYSYLNTFSLAFRIDALSAFFLVAIFAVSMLAAIYGFHYMDDRGKALRTAVNTFFFSVLIAAMALVVTADNLITFMLAWEMMSLSSFFLVVHSYESRENRRAGYLYFVFSQVGAMFIVAAFGVLYAHTGNFGFDGGSSLPDAAKILVFVLAFIGFGSKAGVFPFHVWLPHAHPAAPSHISAVMSGVMIKCGIYGILRIYALLDWPTPVFGTIVLIVGMVTGILGVVYALGQHDLKRLLAYSSVENVGIIMIGVGIGMLAAAAGKPLMALLGFAGALMHVLNHAIFKSLLFMGAGAVLHATGTRSIDSLGGLIKRMRITGTTFLIGALAISGLPPFNGFVSEFLIYFGSFKGVALGKASFALSLLAIISLAVIGGLALALFSKVMGVVFQGEPRSRIAADAHEKGVSMLVPMLVLAAACIVIGVFPTFFTTMALKATAPLALATGTLELTSIFELTANITRAAALFFAVLLLTLALRTLFYRGKTVTRAGTWGCGFTQPTAKMQYTGSSYAASILAFFRPVAPLSEYHPPIQGRFAQPTSYRSHVNDIAELHMGNAIVRPVLSLFDKLRWLQHGDIHLYIGYILLAIVVLLFFV